MRRLTASAGIFLMCFSPLAQAAIAPALAITPETRLAQLEQRSAAAATSAAGEYAKNLLDGAKTSLAGAKVNIAAGKEKIAVKLMEKADIQLSAADAKAAEKEILEKVAVRRSELKKIEARLERFRQGEEN